MSLPPRTPLPLLLRYAYLLARGAMFASCHSAIVDYYMIRLMPLPFARLLMRRDACR